MTSRDSKVAARPLKDVGKEKDEEDPAARANRVACKDAEPAPSATLN